MYVQRIKDKIYTAEQLHKCAFVGLCMNGMNALETEVTPTSEAGAILTVNS